VAGIDNSSGDAPDLGARPSSALLKWPKSDKSDVSLKRQLSEAGGSASSDGEVIHRPAVDNLQILLRSLALTGFRPIAL